jgi:CMP/dCMP kinase
MSPGFIVAIDGTAGSGKSTTARLAAKELGFLHLDTGAMYRAITLKVIRQKLNPEDIQTLSKMLESSQIDLQPVKGRNRVMLDGEDVSEAIRTPEVDKLVSQVSAVPQVRQRLVAEQRRIADGRQVVCEGRDITSVVFPHAQIKFYIDASMAARADRRKAEMEHKGRSISEKTIQDNLTERDYIDSTRSHSPLTRTPDAIYIDTSNITIDEEVMIVTNITRMRMAKAGSTRAVGDAPRDVNR